MLDLVSLPGQQQCHAPSDEIVYRMERNRSPNASGKFPRKAQDHGDWQKHKHEKAAVNVQRQPKSDGQRRRGEQAPMTTQAGPELAAEKQLLGNRKQDNGQKQHEN